ncbi:rod shape-determining protein RodA [Candidatus Daviesbacteria bacterium]|nr:rod shape-determining protein RodA [Candidatus Daviesbacteria bacterium]
MIIPLVLLLILSIAVIYTSSAVLAIQQGIFALIGITSYFSIRSLDYRSLKPLIIYFYVVVLVLLLITLLIGIETRGSTRWISFGPINMQPSEFAKISLILSLALFWSSNFPTWKNTCKSLLITLPFALIVFIQPDLGTALTIIFIWLVTLFAANIDWLKIAVISLIGFIIIPLTWIFLRDYQKQRILSFIFPAQDPLGSGYNVIQSTIAVGSGMFWGKGIGGGTQSHLQFLPEFRTDFIFAFMAEELGFLGSLILLGLFAVIFFFLFRMLQKSKDRFGELIIVGVLGMILFQFLINIGMNIGILPITGITLPLLSYGGSSILTTMIALGLVSSVGKFGTKSKSFDMD